MKKLRLLIVMIAAMCAVSAAPVFAQANTNTSGGGSQSGSSKCGNTKTQIIACDSTTGVGTINSLIKITIQVLTVLIGIVAAGGITYGALLYASARDNQSQVQSAIVIIRNVVIGVLLYGFMVGIINWLVPGGVIG